MNQTYSELVTRLQQHNKPEQFQRQDVSEWKGPFALPEELARFYKEVGPQDLELTGPGNPFYFPRLSKLWEYQSIFADHPPMSDALVFLSEGGELHYVYQMRTGHVYLYDVSFEESELLVEEFGAFFECIAEISLYIDEVGYYTFDEDDDLDVLLTRVGKILGDMEQAYEFLAKIGVTE